MSGSKILHLTARPIVRSDCGLPFLNYNLSKMSSEKKSKYNKAEFLLFIILNILIRL